MATSPNGNETASEAYAAVRRRVRRGWYWVLGFVVLVLAAFVSVWWSQVASANLVAAARVRLVDAAGAPVEGLLVTADWRSWRGIGSPDRCAPLGTSDADGVVGARSLHGEWALGARFAIDVRLPGYDTESVPLAVDTVIVLPPTCSLALQMLDERGEPLRRPDLAYYHAQVSSRTHHNNVKWGDGAMAEFGKVVCGSKLRLSARIQGWSPEDDVVDVPDRPGERVVIHRQVPGDLPRITGVVRNADGSPVREPLGFAFAGYSAFTIVPDPEGRFEFLEHSRASPRDGMLQLRRADGGVVERKVKAGANGWTDCGVLTFER